ncbi:GNAT family N-acetyltransferase [Antribacter gilvus]|uniref:GNAT family N-acetyltransferase n=1 Tax=Antribacter gilvus TaxID=2304675 RepID=UPI0013E0BE1D|nr:GNAT family N-acetyltransferase [Antribacter gilvus]
MSLSADLQVRRLRYADLAGSRTLGSEAYGSSGAPAPLPPEEEWAASPGRSWGAFDGDTLVARLTVFSMTSWFHGDRVPTAGVAGVAVVAERRGEGLLRPLMDAALAEARGRGEAVSTLFPTAPGIYRGWGYEIVGSFDAVELPSSALQRVAPAPGVDVRRATQADLPALAGVHARWSSAQNGPLARAEAPFSTDREWLEDYTGVTVALEDGEITGFTTWDRGQGYDPRTAVIQVDDLVSVTGGAARALWRFLGASSSVVGRVRVATSGLDPAWHVLPDLTTTVVRTRPYMLSVLDVVGALSGLRLTPLTARLPFAVRGAGLDGAFVLEVSDGVTAAAPGPSPAAAAGEAAREAAGAADRPVFSARGLAQLYAGAQSAANLRLAGELTGPADDDATWTALFGGRQVHVRDYF